MMEATKRPWWCDVDYSGVWAGDETPVAYLNWEDSGDETQWLDNYKANAAHIVKCVNAYDKLVAACEAAENIAIAIMFLVNTDSEDLRSGCLGYAKQIRAHVDSAMDGLRSTSESKNESALDEAKGQSGQ